MKSIGTTSHSSLFTFRLLSYFMSIHSAEKSPIKLELLAEIDMAGKNILTIYYGKDTDPDQAQEISRIIDHRYSGLEIGVVDGGQPHYEYIISVD